ncbi:MAG: hypothetical protein ABFQ65_01680 [Nanoarchaeota archaeon]
MENLYKQLLEKGLLIEHKCGIAFCDTFGLPYKNEQILKEIPKTSTNTLKKYGARLKTYLGLKGMLD